MNYEELEDIQSLVESRIEESLTLEYKRQLGKNSDIAKDVSAFANTAGGTIIYGIPDEDKIPSDIAWLTNIGVEELIQNIIITAIYPMIDGTKITRVPNPSNESEAIYVVSVPRSLNAPHMVLTRYYHRRGSVSVPMDDREVKAAMFGSGRNTALRFEISQNLELISRTLKLIERVYVISPEKRQWVALIPLPADAWNSVVASGLLSSFPPEVAKQLVEAYRVVHEVNSLIEWLKIDWGQIVHTPADLSSARGGTYLPAIVRDKLTRLTGLLNQIVVQLETAHNEATRE